MYMWMWWVRLDDVYQYLWYISSSNSDHKIHHWTSNQKHHQETFIIRSNLSKVDTLMIAHLHWVSIIKSSDYFEDWHQSFLARLESPVNSAGNLSCHWWLEVIWWLHHMHDNSWTQKHATIALMAENGHLSTQDNACWNYKKNLQFWSHCLSYGTGKNIGTTRQTATWLYATGYECYDVAW